MIERTLKRFERVLDPFGEGPEASGGARVRTEPLVGHLEPLPDETNRFIWHFARQAKGPLLAILVVGGLAALVDALLFTGVGWIVDALESSTPETLLAEHGTLLFGLAALALVGRAAVMILSSILEEQIVSPSFYNRIRWQSYRRLMDQSYTFFQNDFAGRLATKVQQVGQATGDFVVTLLQTFWSFVAFVVLTSTILGAIDWRMTLVLALWAAGYLWIVVKLLPRIRQLGRERANANSIWTGRVVDAFTNILSVKLFDATRSQDSFVRDGFRMNLEAVWRLCRALTTVRGAVAILNGFLITGVGVVAIVGWREGTVSSGGVATALGLVLRLNQMSGWMMFNINGLVRNYGTVQDAVATITVTPGLVDRPDAKPLLARGGEIRFDRVRFHYGKAGGIVDDFSLTVRSGEKVGLVGRSGAGKTTLVNLLLRLYDLEGGRILVDGQDIAEVSQASLRRAIGVVTQDTSLLHRSIRDNIRYGTDGVDEAAIEAAARRANALSFIPSLRDPKGRAGFDAHVGERGIKLSGGQRQRIAIARVLLKNAPILVLDEATSALDSEVEQAIQESLAEMMAGKTVIAIAHRLSTIAHLDRLVVVDGGRIVEEGTHAELVRGDGLYAALWKRQSGGFIAADAADAAG